MKRWSTCFLVAITSLYFLGGHFCFKVIYAVDVEYRMDPEEAAVAEALRAKTGLEPNVKILRDYQVTAMGGGYSGIFVFSKEIDGREIYFMIDPYPTQTVEQEYFVGRQPKPDGQTEGAVFFERLFLPFIINEVPAAAGWAMAFIRRNFNCQPLRDLFVLPIPTPPPKLG